MVSIYLFSLISVYVNVTDTTSGIKEIAFKIYDRTVQVQVHNGTAKVIERDAPDEVVLRNKAKPV